MYVFVTDTGSRVNVITRRSFSSPIDCDDDKANDYDGAQTRLLCRRRRIKNFFRVSFVSFARERDREETWLDTLVAH